MSSSPRYLKAFITNKEGRKNVDKTTVKIFGFDMLTYVTHILTNVYFGEFNFTKIVKFKEAFYFDYHFVMEISTSLNVNSYTDPSLQYFI